MSPTDSMDYHVKSAVRCYLQTYLKFSNDYPTKKNPRKSDKSMSIKFTNNLLDSKKDLISVKHKSTILNQSISDIKY